MSATKTQAFVLKTQDYRDTSLLGDFYTHDHGKIRGIVKGIRDTRGRFGSTLEPFSLNEILFYKRRRGGDLHQVTQAELVNSFPGVRSDLERLSYASYFTDVLNQLVEVEDPMPAIFDLLNEALLFLESGASPRRSARIFEVKLLDHLGLSPEIRHCVVCRSEPSDRAWFSATWGGIRCGDCAAPDAAASAPANGSANIPVSKGTLHFLGHARRSGVRELYNVKVSQEVGRETEKILRRFVDFHLPYPLKSVAFLEKMGFF